MFAQPLLAGVNYGPGSPEPFPHPRDRRQHEAARHWQIGLRRTRTVGVHLCCKPRLIENGNIQPDPSTPCAAQATFQWSGNVAAQPPNSDTVQPLLHSPPDTAAASRSTPAALMSGRRRNRSAGTPNLYNRRRVRLSPNITQIQIKVLWNGSQKCRNSVLLAFFISEDSRGISARVSATQSFKSDLIKPRRRPFLQ